MSFDPNFLDYSSLKNNIRVSEFSREQLIESGIVRPDGRSAWFFYEWFFATTLRRFLSYTILFLSVPVFVMTNIFINEEFYLILIITAVLVIGGAFVVLVALILRFMMVSRLRLLGFAISNKFKYLHGNFSIPIGPIMFNNGHSKSITDKIILTNNLEISNYTYHVGSGKYERTYVISFAKARLPRAVPHLYLNGITNNFGATVSEYEVQELGLEGDFDRHFALYTPPGYHVDALQLFTPDTMAVLIELGKDYDYEFINNEMYIYAPQGSMNLEERLKGLLIALVRVSVQFSKQASTYSDVRAGNVASGKVDIRGKSFSRKRATWVAIVPIIIIIFGSVGYKLFFEILNNDSNLFKYLFMFFIPVIAIIFWMVYVLSNHYKRKNDR